MSTNLLTILHRVSIVLWGLRVAESSGRLNAEPFWTWAPSVKPVGTLGKT